MVDIRIGKRYFVKMRPIRYSPFIGVTYTVSTDREKWVDCAIVENRFKASSKITLCSLEAGYGREEFYLTDFESLVKEGHIIERTSPKQHVEEIELGRELIGPNMYVVHTGYIVTGGD